MGKIIETRDLVTNFYTYEGVVKALNKVSITVNHGAVSDECEYCAVTLGDAQLRCRGTDLGRGRHSPRTASALSRRVAARCGHRHSLLTRKCRRCDRGTRRCSQR